MRLTASQIETIRQAAHQNFGADASVWLFGSRVDDARRGGDVDLYIEHTRIHRPLSRKRERVRERVGGIRLNQQMDAGPSLVGELEILR